MKIAMVWILKKIKKRIPALGIMVLSHVGTALLGVAFALGTRQIIDSAISQDGVAFRNACLMQGAIIIGILGTLTLYRHLQYRLTADLDMDWKKKIFPELLYGDYENVSQYHTGELLNRLNNDVRVVNEGILNTLPNVASMVTKVLSAMSVLALLEGWFALVIIIAGSIVVLLTTMLRRRLKGLHKKVSEAEGKVSGFLQEALEKLMIVQAMDIAGEMERRADVLLKSRYEVQRKRKNVTLLANTGVSVMSYVASFFALVWCAFGLLNGTMTFGSLTAITQLVGQLQGPFVNLSGVIPQYIAMTAAAERLMELEALRDDSDITKQQQDAKDAHLLYEQMQSIEAAQLCFSYDRDEIIVNGNFSLKKGDFIVITGPSGIGKSTMLKLMLGIFRPDSGKLYVKTETEDILLDRTTRRLFAYVPQGNLLLSGTLRENLMITKPDATEEELQKAIYISAMDEFLSQLPDGLDTVLGENGAGLSEGQAQRIAIARAILSEAPILLLDEVTSSLDEATEKLVLERIRALQDKTCIAITHRAAAVQMSDCRIEMKQENMIQCRQ